MPQSINCMLSYNSSNKTNFNEAKKDYKSALKDTGFSATHQVIQKRNKKKKEKLISFNPSYNKYVKTNVGKYLFNT